MDTLKPKFRFSLKAAILQAGYEHLKDFSLAVETDLSVISRVVKGWLIPGANLQKRMANILGITLKELKELL